MAGKKRRTLRLTVAYDANSATVRDAELVGYLPVLRDPKPAKGSSAVWVTLEAPGRRFSRRLPDPAIGQEVFSKDGTIGRLDPARGRTAIVDVPWHDAPGEVVIRGPGFDVRPPGPPAVTAAAATAPFPVTPLFGGGNRRALTLVFMADGFRADELTPYHEVVDAFLAKLRITEPFAGLMGALAAVRMESTSAESGVDDPAAGRTVETFLDGRFSDPRRLIQVDQDRARRAASRAVGPDRAFVGVVVVNTTEYGGSGGQVAVFSRDPAASDIALHELGHTMFGLADEYSDAGSSLGAPDEPNVTRKPVRNTPTWGPQDRQRLKWRAFLTPAIALPTTTNPDCSQAHQPAGPAGVGAFEGGKYRHCQVFRPTRDCKMRTLTADFCPVCQDVIRRKLATFL